MATFPAKIDQTAALASGDGRDNQAPAIAKDDPCGDHSEPARVEWSNRKRLRELDEDAVTTGELKESRLRKVAVETLEAQATYGAGNAAILKAIQANNAAIQNIRRREKNRAGLWTPILVEKNGDNPVGVVPAMHPQSRGAIFSLSANDVTALEGAFNLPAGRFNAPTLALRQERVLDYLTDGE